MSKLLFSNNREAANQLFRLLGQGKIRRLYHGIYTDNFIDTPQDLIKKHWLQVVSYLVPNGILSFRTALELKPIPYKKGTHIVFMTSSYTKTINILDLVIKVYKGEHRLYCEQVLPTIAKSTMPRMLLENLSIVRSKELKGIKTIDEAGIERYLAREMQFYGENRLNQIRDEARSIAAELGYEREYAKLTKIISALLATHNSSILSSPYAKSVVKKEPYDEYRLQSFENLSIYLNKCRFKERAYQFSEASFRNLSFFESYFSNFIEGTEFIIDEAEDIVFKGLEIYQRHADSHDVLAHFYLANDYFEISKTPRDALEFLNILKARHALLMKERPEKDLGEFKSKANKSGNTYFVLPENVVGTLSQGFELYKLLDSGLAKALFMHYLISEVHPFNDGNGRIARIMLNAELVNAGISKIIVPTVCRENYLGGLRRATRDNYFQTYCKVMDQAQAYTASIDWADYGGAREKIEQDNANQTADEGLAVFNRTLRELALSELTI